MMEKLSIKVMEELSRKRIIYLLDTFCAGDRKEFADKVGIGKSSISQYVNGTNSPGNITAMKIGKAFGVDPMWVMGFDVPMNKADIAEKISNMDLDLLDLQIMELYKKLPVEKKKALIKLLEASSE